MTETENRARAILERLVAFPTVSRDSNLPLIDWVEDYLAGHGVTAHRVWNEDRTKAGLYANVGPEVAGGVVLSGHSDVVPVDGQAWASDPWTLTERDGRLYGRGTCDMKGFVALALAAVPAALEVGVRRPLQLAISYDEELGCTGAPPLIAALARALPPAAAVVVGEPSMMRPIEGHKGGMGFRLRLRGHEVHSSLLPEGVSAIHEAGRILDWVNRTNAALAAAAPSVAAERFVPPFTTVHVGRIAGGTAQNITAGGCELTLDIRAVPGEALSVWEERVRALADEVAAGMRAIHPDTGIEVARIFHVPPLAPEPDGAAVSLVHALTGENGRGVVSYGTEGGQFQDAGYSAVICGPGDIAQAHQPDEFVSVAQFRAGAAFIDRLVAHLSA